MGDGNEPNDDGSEHCRDGRDEHTCTAAADSTGRRSATLSHPHHERAREPTDGRGDVEPGGEHQQHNLASVFRSFWEPLGVPKAGGYYEQIETSLEITNIQVHEVLLHPDFVLCPSRNPVFWRGPEIVIAKLSLGPDLDLFPFSRGGGDGGPFPRMCCRCSVKDFFLSLEALENCSTCKTEGKKFEVELRCLHSERGSPSSYDSFHYERPGLRVQPLKDIMEFSFGFDFGTKETSREKQFRKDLYDLALKKGLEESEAKWETLHNTPEVWIKVFSEMCEGGERCLAPSCTRSLKGNCFKQFEGTGDLRHFVDFSGVHDALSFERYQVSDCFGSQNPPCQLKVNQIKNECLREVFIVQQSYFHISVNTVCGKTYHKRIEYADNEIPDSLVTSDASTADQLWFTGIFVSPLFNFIGKSHEDRAKHTVKSLQKLTASAITRLIVEIGERQIFTDKTVCTCFLHKIEDLLSKVVFSSVALGILNNAKEILAFKSVGFDTLFHVVNHDTVEKHVVRFSCCNICDFCLEHRLLSVRNKVLS